MLILGIILLIIGLLVGALLHHQIGYIIAVVGVILIVIWLILLLVDTSDAHAALMLPFTPQLARWFHHLRQRRHPWLHTPSPATPSTTPASS